MKKYIILILMISVSLHGDTVHFRKQMPNGVQLEIKERTPNATEYHSWLTNFNKRVEAMKLDKTMNSPEKRRVAIFYCQIYYGNASNLVWETHRDFDKEPTYLNKVGDNSLSIIRREFVVYDATYNDKTQIFTCVWCVDGSFILCTRLQCPPYPGRPIVFKNRYENDNNWKFGEPKNLISYDDVESVEIKENDSETKNRLIFTLKSSLVRIFERNDTGWIEIKEPKR